MIDNSKTAKNAFVIKKNICYGYCELYDKNSNTNIVIDNTKKSILEPNTKWIKK